MPSHSQKQRRWIFYLRGKYKSKADTPQKWKWIWEDDWTKIEEEYYDSQSNFHQYLEMAKHDLKDVEDFAIQKHGGQKRRSGEPYMVHPKSVVDRLVEAGAPTATIAAGWLHDTLEDTDTTYQEIVEKFGVKVAKLVKHVTSDPDEIEKIGKTEHLKKKVKNMPKNAMTLKLADRLTNLSDLDQSRLKYAHQTIDILNELNFEKLDNMQQIS